MLEGSANKVAFVVVFVSACCWVIYAAGFAIRYEEMSDPHNNITMVTPVYFTHWCFLVSGVPFYLLTFLHLLCGNIATAMLVLVLLPVHLVTAGGVLDKDGSYLYQYYDEDLLVEYKDYAAVEFAGAIGVVFFYWLSLVLWVCHSYGDRSRRIQQRRQRDYENINY